jgi:hypothetical protein
VTFRPGCVASHHRIRKVNLTNPKQAGQVYSANRRSTHQAFATINWIGQLGSIIAGQHRNIGGNDAATVRGHYR